MYKVQRPRSQIPRFVTIFSIKAYNNLIFKQDQQGRKTYQKPVFQKNQGGGGFNKIPPPPPQ